MFQSDSGPTTQIGSGSGGGKPEWVLEIMLDELAKVEFDGVARIVRFRKATKGGQAT
jgi:hypothetical protein